MGALLIGVGQRVCSNDVSRLLGEADDEHGQDSPQQVHPDGTQRHTDVVGYLDEVHAAKR